MMKTLAFWLVYLLMSMVIIIFAIDFCMQMSRDGEHFRITSAFDSWLQEIGSRLKCIHMNTNTRKTCNVEAHRSRIDGEISSVIKQMSSLGYQLEGIDLLIDGPEYDCDLSFYRNTKPRYPEEKSIRFYDVFCDSVDETMRRVDKIMGLVGLKRVDQDINIDMSFASGELEYKRAEPDECDESNESDFDSHPTFWNTFSAFLVILFCISFLVVMVSWSMMMHKNDCNKRINDKYEMLTSSSSASESI